MQLGFLIQVVVSSWPDVQAGHHWTSGRPSRLAIKVPILTQSPAGIRRIATETFTSFKAK